MWSAVFCFSIISAVSAAPRYSFLQHYGNPMQSGPSNQVHQAVNDMFPPSHPHAGMTTPISMEILLPPSFPGSAGGQGSGTGNMFPGLPSHLQPGVNTPISIELFHPGFQGTAAGGQGSRTGLIKYSIPKAPGRKSIEIYYPYNFAQGELLPNVLPQIPNVFPFNYLPQQQPPRQAAPAQGNNQPFIFNYPPQTSPQQQPPRAAPQANDPQQQIQQDPQVPTGQP
ncbi:hypothetical protein AMELA_G00271820 [Ameiurus melas]|uniref:Secretory calcium-binding phosphoprotein 5 n=1 Tax=Ameiurus melas TaxID=219545 RepID=A0A7J5ZNY4_AMEME|nr:hypothetical protein AMELA_G00271820 [Ameiurus melas]